MHLTVDTGDDDAMADERTPPRNAASDHDSRMSSDQKQDYYDNTI